MTPKRQRALMAAATAAQLLVLGALLAWRLAAAGGAGWAGLVFLPALDLGDLEVGSLDVLREVPGVVLLVVPGSPAARAGIAPGDVIAAVGGVPVTAAGRLRELAAARRAGDAVTFDLGTRRAEVTLVAALESPGALPDVLAGALLAAAFLVVVAVAFWLRPGAAGARLLYLLGAAGAALFAVEAAARLEVPDLAGLAPLGVDPLLGIVYGVRLVLLVVTTDLLLHFTLVFPRPRPVAARGPRLFAALHVAPFLPLLASAAAWGVARPAGLSGTTAVLALVLFSALMLAACLAILLLYSLWTCGALYRNYRDGDARERQQVLWPLWGILAALVGMLLLALGVAAILAVDRDAGTAAARWMALPARLLTLLVPISLACGVLGKKLPWPRPGLFRLPFSRFR